MFPVFGYLADFGMRAASPKYQTGKQYRVFSTLKFRYLPDVSPYFVQLFTVQYHLEPLLRVAPLNE